MPRSVNRRVFLLSAATLPLALPRAARSIENQVGSSADLSFAALERTFGGRLGVCALNTGNGAQIRHRADERFPFCSTFKVMLSGAILARSARDASYLQQRVRYAQTDLVNYSPVTEKHVGEGMTVSELCAAAIQYSDNTAANLLTKLLGGPGVVTAFARSIGDRKFRLDRWETELNSCIPGDPRDTSTPAAMARSMRALALGDALAGPQRKQLQDWLRGSTTGAKRIRAGVPENWQAGDKTGSGDYGTTNDLAVLWPPARSPIVLAVYFTQTKADAKWQDDVIAAAARVVVSALG
jgi:beta-lactamase class A